MDRSPKPPLCNKRLVYPYIDYYGRYGFINKTWRDSSPYTVEDIIKIGNEQIIKNKLYSQQKIDPNTTTENIVNGYYDYTKGPLKLEYCKGERIRYFDQINKRWVVFDRNQYTIEDFTWRVNINNNIFSII